MKKTLLLVVVLQLTLFLCAAIPSSSFDQDCKLLYALFNTSDNGPYWTNNSGWASYNPSASTSSSDCCTWAGVQCDPSSTSGQLQSVSLPSNNISLPLGLPREWGQLTSLQKIDLAANFIEGHLPEEYSNLANLTSLSIEYNHVTGSIPVSWAGMSKLAFFNIGHNHLEGKIPRLSACTMVMCSNMGLNSSLQEIDFGYVAQRCTKIWWYLIATGVTGYVPCPPNVKTLELSYTFVTGAIPCCPGLVNLGLEGTNVSSWAPCAVTASNISSSTPPPVLSELFLSNSAVQNVPENISAMFPSLTMLSLRNLKLVQPLPSFPASLAVLDAAGNAFTKPANGGMHSMEIGPSFKLLDITSTLAEGVGLDSINFTCNASYAPGCSSDCILQTSTYTALGKEYKLLPSEAIKESDLLNPMLRLLPNGLLLSHMLYTFISGLSCMFRPTLIVQGTSLPGISGISPYFKIPEPSWNHTFFPIAPTPSTIAAFDGLVGETLLFGLDYRLDVSFLYRPVVLSSTGSIGSVQKNLVIGRVTLPVCNEQLFAVPFTTLCVACPDSGICNGSSVVQAKRNFWRSRANALPFYECDTAGCQSPTARLGPECAEGFAGPLCSSCAPNYGKSTSGGCIECSSNGWNIGIVSAGALLFLLAASFAAVKSVKGEENETAPAGGPLAKFMSEQSRILAATSVKKIQSHMGVYALVGRLALAANHSTESVALQTVQQVASQLSLRSVSFVTCLFPTLNVLSQFQAMLVIVPSLLVFEVLVVRWRRKKWAVFSVVSSICVLLYDMSINIALLLIPVDTFTFYDATQYTVNRTFATPIDSTSVLSLDRAVRSGDSATVTWRIVAFVWLGVFGIGLPLLICSVIHHMFVTGRRAQAEEQFAFLTSTYRKKRWYWEQIIVLRKFALAAVVVGLKPYPLTQAQGLLVVLMVYVIFMEWQAPFVSSAMHNAERTTCAGAIIIVNTIMATTSSSSSSSSSSSILGSSAAVSTESSSALSIVNSVIQYGSLATLIAFLVLEWIRRATPPAEEETPDAASSSPSAHYAPSSQQQMEKVVDDKEPVPLADLMTGAEFYSSPSHGGGGDGRTRSFSLSRARSFSPLRSFNRQKAVNDSMAFEDEL